MQLAEKLGWKGLERIKNEHIKEIMGVKQKPDIIDIIERKRLQWYGHVKRMQEERLPKLIMKWIPGERRKRQSILSIFNDESIRSFICLTHVQHHTIIPCASSYSVYYHYLASPYSFLQQATPHIRLRNMFQGQREKQPNEF
jgi:predicted phosphoadenosine phosphosulfate sulfurtransferase